MPSRDGMTMRFFKTQVMPSHDGMTVHFWTNGCQREHFGAAALHAPTVVFTAKNQIVRTVHI